MSDGLRQLGLVVDDIDIAIKHWTRAMEVGPFLLLRNRVFADYEYRGASSEPPVVSIAIAFTDAFQIELIQQHNDAPSAYREYEASRGKWPQHLCKWYADGASYDAAYERLRAQGRTVVHQGRSKGVNMRFAYFEFPGMLDGPVLEISEALLPVCKQMFDQLQKEGAEWTGEPPFREIVVAGN